MLSLDRYTRVLLTLIALLLAAVAIPLWFQTPTLTPTAQAGIPDQGQQLNEVIVELQGLRGEISQLRTVLETGKAKVQVIEPPAPPAKQR